LLLEGGKGKAAGRSGPRRLAIFVAQQREKRGDGSDPYAAKEKEKECAPIRELKRGEKRKGGEKESGQNLGRHLAIFFFRC